MKVKEVLSILKYIDEELEIYAYSESVGKSFNINNIFTYGNANEIYAEINLE